MTSKTCQGRLITLDGLRGVAALIVMSFHAGANSPFPMPSGYLAVDLFFALSGFVLTQAYDAKLRQGLPIWEFAAQRLIRIYPMLFVGAVFGIAIGLGKPASLLLVPDFGSGGALFPGNVPMWSLLFELAVNLAFALFAARTGWRGIAAILLVSGAILLIRALWQAGSLAGGGYWNDWQYGPVRTVFSFTLGVAIFRLRARNGLQVTTTWRAWLLFPLLAAALAFQPAAHGLWEVACVFLIMPVLIWWGAGWQCPRGWLPAQLGNISYPLYCIHSALVANLATSPQQGTVLFIALIVAAWSFDRYYDRPVRAMLGAMLKRSGGYTRIGIST